MPIRTRRCVYTMTSSRPSFVFASVVMLVMQVIQLIGVLAVTALLTWLACLAGGWSFIEVYDWVGGAVLTLWLLKQVVYWVSLLLA
jgi:hypothetical protein